MLSFFKEKLLLTFALGVFVMAVQVCARQAVEQKYENASLNAQVKDSFNKLRILQDAGVRCAEREASIRADEQERIELFENATVVYVNAEKARGVMDDQTRINLIRRLNRPL